MTTNRFYIIASLAMTYFVFAILLNSVGVVMLQVINNFDVSKSAASQLEGFKDLPIAIVSFLVAASLPRFGYRKAMIAGLAIVMVACLITPSFPSFLTTKLLFLAIGVAFALVKVSIYSSIGLLTDSSSKHASLMNLVEGIFMVGVLLGYWWFSSFSDNSNPQSVEWMNIYYYIAALAFANIILLLFAPKDALKVEFDANDKSEPLKEFASMIKLLKLPIVCVFALSVFMYVLIEQGIGTWLPTFNNQILMLPTDMSIQATSIYAVCLAIGRLSAGVMLRFIKWNKLITICLASMAVLIIVVLPLADNVEAQEDINWFNVPLAAYIFPLIGLFMAPIYPVVNSVILSAFDKTQQSSMAGMIIIFSALGGTTGSILIGAAFDMFEGATAFYLTLIPVLGIAVCIVALQRFINQRNMESAAT